METHVSVTCPKCLEEFEILVEINEATHLEENCPICNYKFSNKEFDKLCQEASTDAISKLTDYADMREMDFMIDKSYISFTLSMPNRGSWNGGWSGEGKPYVIVKNFTGKKGCEKARDILSKGSYYYNSGDGWGANIDVKEVDLRESRKLKRASAGFNGYDWMVTSICDKQCIETS